MAPAKTDPLPVLDQMLNQVLVQTGKALKAVTKDSSTSVSAAGGAIRDRSIESINTYHFALDDIESDILCARAVLMRDLAKLRAARAPPPPPTPPPEPEQRQRQPIATSGTTEAPMLDLPSAAAHTINPPPFVPGSNSNPVAPFPDMGLDMSTDMVDLTSKDTKPQLSVPPAPMQQPSGPDLPVKHESKPTVTSKTAPDAATQPSSTQPKQSANGQTTGEDASFASMLDLPGGGAGAAPASVSEAPEFTNMQFSLDTSTTGAQNAPPAPMPAFDLTTFANGDGSGDFTASANFEPIGTGIDLTNPPTTAKDPQNDSKALDDVFNLDSGADNMDLDLDLGTGNVNDSTFDDLFLDSGDSSGMGQFDNAFFGLD